MALETSIVAGTPRSHKTDLLAVLVREGEKLDSLDEPLGGLLAQCAEDEEFTGKEGQVLSLHTHGKLGARRIAAIGLGRSVAGRLRLRPLQEGEEAAQAGPGGAAGPGETRPRARRGGANRLRDRRRGLRR